MLGKFGSEKMEQAGGITGQKSEVAAHDGTHFLPIESDLAGLCQSGQLLVATIGLPASGKTTWATKLLAEAPCFVRVNSDDLRQELPHAHEARIHSLRDQRIMAALAEGHSVVVDNTNLRGVSDLRNLARRGGAAFAVRDFRDVGWLECVRRDAERASRGEHATGRSVIIRMAMQARLFGIPPTVNKEAIIVDLDGTLADVEHRIHHVRSSKKDWKAFFTGIPGDSVNHAVAALYRMAVLAGYTVLFVSGRPENYRAASEKWLAENAFDDYFALFMRPAGDNKQDTEVKSIIYDRLIAPYFDVVFTVDDRDAVVKMWRAKGLVCMQVAEGDF